MIKNVLFDMGGVLLRYDPKLFVARLGLNEEDSLIIRREVFGSAEWVCLDRGSLSAEDAIDSMCKRIPERLHAAAREIFWHWDTPRLPMEGSVELVRELSENGYRLYLLSNAGVRHPEYWKDMEVAQYFGDRLMVSAFYGVLKPEAEFYKKAFELFSLDPAECVFIDDSPGNIEAAARVGLDGIVFHGDHDLLRVRLREKGVKI